MLVETGDGPVTSRLRWSLSAVWPGEWALGRPLPLGLGDLERLAEHMDGLFDSGRCGGGLADGVEHHEVVDDAVVADAGGAHAGLGELASIGLALVAKDVVLVDDEE